MTIRWILLLILMQALVSCSDERAIQGLADEGDKIVAAIDAHKAAHGTLPQSLAMLEESNKLAIPSVDAWTYVTNDDGTYVLYAYLKGRHRISIWFLPTAEEGVIGWWLDREDGRSRVFVRGKK
jgi:hypothetical protein